MKKILCALCLVICLFGCSSFEDRLIKVSEVASPSVIRVEANCRKLNEKGVMQEVTSIGSGVIYKSFGITKEKTILLNSYKTYDNYQYYCLTNSHVVNDGYAIRIWIDETEEYCNALVLGVDDKLDIAVLSFNYDKYIDSIELGTSSELVKGSVVVAIGNPDGYYDSMTLGILSYPFRYVVADTNNDKKEDYTYSFLQIDAAINPGSSGGGLFNIEGHLVGINTMKIVNEQIEGLGFAIPIDDIKPILKYLESGIIPTRLRLGLSVIAIDNKKNTETSNYGVVINNISYNGFGKEIGLKVNDIILSVNDNKLLSLVHYYLYVNTIIMDGNTNVTFEILRNNEKMTINTIV